jgi:hypothetical protein
MPDPRNSTTRIPLVHIGCTMPLLTRLMSLVVYKHDQVPTFLDLNAPDNKDESRSGEPDMLPKHKDDAGRQATSSRSTTPGGILSTASALVPSFLHSSSAVASTEGKSTSTSASDGKIPQKDKQDDLPPNPLARDADSPERRHNAETIQHYVRDHKRRLSKRLSANGADEALPKVKHGEGEPPNILYKDGERITARSPLTFALTSHSLPRSRARP